jgi:hypothetical protein
MGADSTLIFYGLRFLTDESESDALQTNTDARVLRAREHELAHWWGNFAQDDINEQSYLFIGSLIGNIGHEGNYEICLSGSELNALIEVTNDKLRKAGFDGEARLYIQFEPDY